jgi:hypothetical protein
MTMGTLKDLFARMRAFATTEPAARAAMHRWQRAVEKCHNAGADIKILRGQFGDRVVMLDKVPENRELRIELASVGFVGMAGAPDLDASSLRWPKVPFAQAALAARRGQPKGPRILSRS